jgi:hypothetical protein
MLLGLLKALLIFLSNIFLQTGFFSVKITFKPLKHNPKQALKACLRLNLRNRASKSKRAFAKNVFWSFLSFLDS